MSVDRMPPHFDLDSAGGTISIWRLRERADRSAGQDGLAPETAHMVMRDLRSVMRPLLPLLVIGWGLIVLGACDTATPEQYFSRAVLNSNLLYGFAGPGMQRQLASPPVKLTDVKTGASAPMKRAEVLKEKRAALEGNLAKVKALRSTADTQEMLKAALVLYDFVLPVYRNEYTELAALYDSGAAAEKIATVEQAITDKYAAKFQDLHRALLAAGKIYAAKHNIPVKEVTPEPQQ